MICMTMKKKITRDLIYSVLRKSDIPMKASEIRDEFSKKPDLATIYRSLDKMERDGSVGVFTAKGRSRLYYISEENGGHFISCQMCKRIEKLDQCGFKEIKAQIEKRNKFKVTGHILFIKGVCNECIHAFNSEKKRSPRS